MSAKHKIMSFKGLLSSCLEAAQIFPYKLPKVQKVTARYRAVTMQNIQPREPHHYTPAKMIDDMNLKSFIEDKKALNSTDYDCKKVATKKDIFMVEGKDCFKEPW